MKELKNCPFCGSNNLFLGNSNEIHNYKKGEQHFSTYPYFKVVCSVIYEGDKSYNYLGCGASGGYYCTKEEAIENWNRRAK